MMTAVVPTRAMTAGFQRLIRYQGAHHIDANNGEKGDYEDYRSEIEQNEPSSGPVEVMQPFDAGGQGNPNLWNRAERAI